MASPIQVGSYDTLGDPPEAYAVTARDSFVSLVTQHLVATGFRVIDVLSPDNPLLVGLCRTRNFGRAAVQRDSLVFVAEDYNLGGLLHRQSAESEVGGGVAGW